MDFVRECGVSNDTKRADLRSFKLIMGMGTPPWKTHKVTMNAIVTILQRPIKSIIGIQKTTYVITHRMSENKEERQMHSSAEL